jgi:hypothetical protein
MRNICPDCGHNNIANAQCPCAEKDLQRFPTVELSAEEQDDFDIVRQAEATEGADRDRETGWYYED